MKKSDVKRLIPLFCVLLLAAILIYCVVVGVMTEKTDESPMEAQESVSVETEKELSVIPKGDPNDYTPRTSLYDSYDSMQLIRDSYDTTSPTPMPPVPADSLFSKSVYIYVFDGYESAIMLDRENSHVHCPVVYQKDNVYILSNIDDITIDEISEVTSMLYYANASVDMLANPFFCGNAGMSGGPSEEDVVIIGSLAIVCD